MLLGVLQAFDFDHDRYAATDLDALLAQSRPRKGFDTFPPRPQAAATACGCGTPDFHPGVDFTNDGVAGAPVRPAADGVIVKVETDENASVPVPTIGRCGRYVVIRHSYPEGRVVFTRYAQLGRVVGSDGQPLAPGAKVKSGDKIGEVGSKKVLHFEVRPAEPASMDKSEAWIAQYGADPAMEWPRYQTVDPQTFDFDKLWGRGGK